MIWHFLHIKINGWFCYFYNTHIHIPHSFTQVWICRFFNSYIFFFKCEINIFKSVRTITAVEWAIAIDLFLVIFFSSFFHFSNAFFDDDDYFLFASHSATHTVTQLNLNNKIKKLFTVPFHPRMFDSKRENERSSF